MIFHQGASQSKINKRLVFTQYTKLNVKETKLLNLTTPPIKG